MLTSLVGDAAYWIYGGVIVVGLGLGILLLIVASSARRRAGAQPGAGTVAMTFGILSLVLLAVLPLILLVVELVSPESTTSRRSSAPKDIDVSVSAPPATREARTWRGSYFCGQGETGLEVTLRPVGGGRLEGTFSFYPTSSNLAAATGCFNITAEADRASQRVRTRAASWIRQPTGYYTVDLDGRVGPDGSWSGQVIGGSCSSFSLRPVAQPVASCAGGGATPGAAPGR